MGRRLLEIAAKNAFDCLIKGAGILPAPFLFDGQAVISGHQGHGVSSFFTIMPLIVVPLLYHGETDIPGLQTQSLF